ncbi:MAG: type II secretion system minor pseudopilin GspI [Pseudomonadota bacterium]
MTDLKRHRQRGMTLIEVLVAFAILAGLSVSVLALLGQNAQYIVSAEQRLFARVAADNLLTEELARRAPPDTGGKIGKIVVSNHAFTYEQTVVEVGSAALFIEYSIQLEDAEQVIARASAVKAR